MEEKKEDSVHSEANSKKNTKESDHSARLVRISNGIGSLEDLKWYNAWCNAQQTEILPLNDFNEKQLGMLQQINVQIDRSVSVYRMNIICITAAATLFLAFSTALYFYVQPGATPQHTVELVGNDLAPGRNSATLTLADGRRIVLSAAKNGQLAKESGVSVSKAADGQLVYEIKENPSASREKAGLQYNTLATNNGEQYRVRLPDGTMVWLNAASSIRYPASFASLKERKVELTGEAYFEVTKDRSHPFIVEGRGQQVKVLGTHFNVNNYQDESSTKTTLLEGSVEINNHTLIEPGEQATGNAGQLKVSRVDTEAAVDWKNGDFIFNKGDDFKSAMRKIARWYDVEIVYDDAAYTGMELRGWLSRTNKLSVVLQTIESTGKVHFKIEGRRVTVTK